MRSRAIATVSAAGVVLAGLAVPGTSVAGPAAPEAASIASTAAAPLNTARMTLRPGFAAIMPAEKVSLVWDGRVSGTGRTRDVGLTRQTREMYLMAATLTLRGPSGRLDCRKVGVDAVSGVVRCERANGTMLQLFRLTPATSTAGPDGTYSQKATMRVASSSVARLIERTIGSDIFVRQPLVADYSVARQLPARASGKDARAGCERDSYARDTLVNRGWAVQQIVNNLPQNLTVSQWVKPPGETAYRLMTPQAPQTNLGQRTPLKEGGVTTDHKKITSGSKFYTDYFYEDYSYLCHTMAPYVVSPGPVDPAKDSTPWYTEQATAWNYDGVVRTPGNSAGARPTWWAHPRQSDRDSPIGSYSWTCRGTPSGRAKADTYWKLVKNGTGFYGDAGETDSAAGSAPDCQDANLADTAVVTKYAVSKLGYMKGRGESGWPRGCSVDAGAVVGCGQEVYSLDSLNGFTRAWAFQHHIFASALRAQISSDLFIKVPPAYDPLGVGYDKAVAWRIVDGTVSGAWPRFTDSGGTAWDLSGASIRNSAVDFGKVSAYTVPGDGSTFTLSGYGSPNPGTQKLTFLLIADTDGNGGWKWPTVQDGPNKGLPLARPRVNITLTYDMSNFNDGSSCRDEMSSWWSGWSGTSDSAGIHCLEGTIPTIWPLSANSANNEKRVVDQYVADRNDANKKVENRATPQFSVQVAKSCFNSSRVEVYNTNENDVKAVPVVGADYTWKIHLTGWVQSFESCPS